MVYHAHFSSIGGLVSCPVTGSCHATKYVVEGLSESLWQEVEPLGIKVMVVEPSGFRTDWAGRSANETKRRIDDYAAIAGASHREIRFARTRDRRRSRAECRSIVRCHRIRGD